MPESDAQGPGSDGLQRRCPSGSSIEAVRRAGRAYVFFGVVLVLGCDATEHSQALIQRDSAGIGIREYPATTSIEGLRRLTAVEVVSIGALEGDEAETFNRVGDMAGDSEGRIHVLDVGDQLVEVFNPDGGWVRRYGGRGEGPAEFQGASLLIRLGDSMGVFDYRNQKVALFGPDGSLLATRRWELPIFTFGFPSRLAGIPGGLAAVFETGCSMPPPADRRPTWKLLTLGPGGMVKDTVMVRFRSDIIALYGERFCSVLPALAGSGYELAVRSDGTAAFTAEREYEVVLFRLNARGDTDGQAAPLRPHLIIRRALLPTTVTDGQVEEYRSRYLETPEDGRIDRDRLKAIQEALDSTDVPNSYPKVAALLWDGDGRLWVGRTVEGDVADRTWDVYDDEGRLVAEAVLPAKLEYVWVTHDMVWGTLRDDVEVPYVRGYRLKQTAGSDG